MPRRQMELYVHQLRERSEVEKKMWGNEQKGGYSSNAIDWDDLGECAD